MQKRISKQKHDTSMTGKKCNRLKNRNVHGLSKDFLTFTPKRRWTMTLSHLKVCYIEIKQKQSWVSVEFLV